MNAKITAACVFLSLLMVISASLGAQAYKYKDTDGKWVYTDKKPTEDADATELDSKVHKIALPTPELSVTNEAGEYQLTINNPYYSPIEILVNFADRDTMHISKVIEPNSSEVLLQRRAKISNYDFLWVLGRPWAKPKKFLYEVPIGSPLPHIITQAFNGRFSHYTPDGQYALDIAADVGTEVVAARGGTVIWVKDDYHMSGTQLYFLDKANFVSVLHDDDTYATYAHTLLGSAVVKPGDKVEAGDMLAKSGSSGFSTGPHLHFVIQKNDGFKTVSVPFQIADKDGRPATPSAGMKLFGTKSDSSEVTENQTSDFRLQQVELLDFADEEPEETQSVEEYLEETLLDLNCEQARINTVILSQQHLPIFWGDNDQLYAEWHYDVYEGERTYLSKEEQQQEQNRLQSIIDETCRDPDSEEIMMYYHELWIRSEQCGWLRSEAEKFEDPKYNHQDDYIEARHQEADDMCDGTTPLE